MVQAGPAGRLVRDRRQHPPVGMADAALDEAAALGAAGPGGAVEDGAVEPALVDIGEEVGGRDRRVPAVELDDDRAHAGLDPHAGRRRAPATGAAASVGRCHVVRGRAGGTRPAAAGDGRAKEGEKGEPSNHALRF